MRKCLQVLEIKNYLKDLRKNNTRIGYVPTMGALHGGHQELIKRCQEDNDVTIVSIFVNPRQFNDPADFDAYPRLEKQDFELLEKMGVNAVFQPSEKEIYPKAPEIQLDLGDMASVLEGQFRPGHFQGVCLVLSKFFNILRPDQVYLGLKDLQQFLLVTRMVEDLSFDLQVVGVPTKRESSGLALSSRNLRLSSEGKRIATHIFKGLELAKRKFEGRIAVEQIARECREFYERVDGFELEYCEIVDASTLRTFSSYNGVNTIAMCVAAYVEGVRLIDNLYLAPPEGLLKTF